MHNTPLIHALTMALIAEHATYFSTMPLVRQDKPFFDLESYFLVYVDFG